MDEVKGLKMRLRFREEGIKRLQAVASGKLSVESHLLQEKEELLKEIEVLRNQVDRNPEVTRFAMENLRLKEELRRHVFCALPCGKPFFDLLNLRNSRIFHLKVIFPRVRKFFSFSIFVFRVKMNRLQSFVAEGEREMMNEQITDLQEKVCDSPVSSNG